MKNLVKIVGIVLTLLSVLLCSNVLAQPGPPDGGSGSGTNVYTYTPPPYFPGLKLAIPAVNGSNLQLNLLEADPAGTYSIYSATGLSSVTWSNIVQGTNGQTNFALLLPTNNYFYRTARTDTPVTNTAGMTVTFPNTLVNTNVVPAVVANGPAAAMLVLVNSTNFSTAKWIPFSSVPLVLLGTNDGTYQVWFGFVGSNGQTNWTSASVTIDTVPPQLVITNPTNSTSSVPLVQLQGYTTKPLSAVSYDLTNAAGIFTNQPGYVTQQYYDTTLARITTNWIECVDINLMNGGNSITLRVTDLAGNTTTTNLSINCTPTTNPPSIQLTWPQNGTLIAGNSFTWSGQVSDPTATITASTTDTNGDTSVYNAVVGRDGNFWLDNLPVSGTNVYALAAITAGGSTTTTNVTVTQSSVTVTMNPVTPTTKLWLQTATLSGTVSDSSYHVTVNGVAATNNAGNTWNATNVPVTTGGAAVFAITASNSART